MAHWNIPVGTVLKRRKVHEEYGGSLQDGISHPKNSDLLLLFPTASGPRDGYTFDGWRSDDTYHYAGEGHEGDQKFNAGNAALRDHVSLGTQVRLFEGVKESSVRYLGEFRLADESAFYYDEAPDRYEDLRKVIVFRLLSVDSTPADSEQPPGAPSAPLVRDVPIDQHQAETYQSDPTRAPTNAERREAKLVARYAASLAEQGVGVTRKEIRLADLSPALYTDLFDATRNELVEATSSASRTNVRLAIGQLLDHGRFVDCKSPAVLLPTDPGSDLLDLLHGLGITCIWEDKGGTFVRSESGSGPKGVRPERDVEFGGRAHVDDEEPRPLVCADAGYLP